MMDKVKATSFVPSDSRKLASVCWKNFPAKGDTLTSVLMKDGQGNYFVQESYNWSQKPFLIPKSRHEAELYYFFYAQEVFDEF